MNGIPTLAETMTADSRHIIESVFFPDLAADFERKLLEAETAEANDADGLVKLISLAYAVQAVADAKEGFAAGSEMQGRPAFWYREMGQRLLVRSMDAISRIAVSEGYRPVSGLH
jgi:hypothetical protein